jgi:hypothetical protein
MRFPRLPPIRGLTKGLIFYRKNRLVSFHQSGFTALGSLFALLKSSMTCDDACGFSSR